MSQRSYTLNDLDTMRRQMRALYRPLSFAEREDLLRTYLVAGIGPEDLQERVDAEKAMDIARLEQYRKRHGGLTPWEVRNLPPPAWAEGYLDGLLDRQPAKPRRTLAELTKAIADAKENSNKRYGHG